MTPLAAYTQQRAPIGSLEQSWRDQGDRYTLDRADVSPPLFASWIPGGPVSVCVQERVRIHEERRRQVTRYRWVRGETVAACRRCATAAAIELAMTHRRDEDAREEAERRVRSAPAPSPAPADIIERARRYLERVEPSIAGSGGRNSFFHAAQVLMRGFALTLDQALPLAMEYDARSQPVWGLAAVRAKLKDALRRGRMEMGCLLAKGKGKR